MWNFIIGPAGGNIFTVVGVLLILAAFVMVEQTRPDIRVVPTPPTPAPPNAGGTSPTAGGRNYPVPSDRPIVNESPDDLLKFFKDHTHIQAQKLLETYIGQWMVIRDVEVINVITLANGKLFVNANTNAALTFNEDWKPKVSVLRKGSRITAIGQIKGVLSTGSNLDLDNCELLG